MPTRMQPWQARRLSAAPFAIGQLNHTGFDFFAANRHRRRSAGAVFSICALLLMFFSPATAQNQNDLKRAQEFYEKALPKKNPAERIELLQKAAQSCASQIDESQLSVITPAARRQMAMIYFALGREFYRQVKWPPALAHLEKAAGLDSTFLSAHAMLGLIYFQQRKYEPAIAAYHKVLRAQPSAQLYNNLGAAHEGKGDLSAAVAAYRRALELDAKLVLAQKNLQRVQEKFALANPVSPAAVKVDSADSARLAAPQRDALAVVAPKAVLGSNKTKSAKNKKIEKPRDTIKNLPPPKSPVAEKRAEEKTSIKSQAWPATRESGSARSAISPESALKKDPVEVVAVNLEKEINALPVAPLQSSPLTSTTSNSDSSEHSPLAYICGAGVVLLGVFIFTQRRRLGRVWLQLKPALVTPATGAISEEHLLPSRIKRHPINTDEEDEIKFPLNRMMVAEESIEAETGAADSAAALETRQPSLQTQAFFAEMIAGEPDIDEFEEVENEIERIGTTFKPANGRFEDTSSAALPKEDFAETVERAEALRAAPLIVPFDTTNGKNGHVAEPPDPDENSNGFAAVENEIDLSSTNEKLELIETDIKPPAAHIESATGASQQVLGRYLIECEIGKGAMGKIYLAFDPKLDRKVVIKTVCFNLASSETDTATLKDRVYREARAIAKLGHPNIVVVYDVEDDKDLSYIVMEHIEGRDLRQALKSERRFDLSRAVKIITQVCSALDCAHQAGIIHRDIKPSNIMLLQNDKAKVTDFGIAKIADNFSLTLPGHVLGTPSYMAPEQFDGETFDSRADIFSLGVVFYELLTGTRPFSGDSLAALAYKIVHKMHIPPSLQNVELPLELDEIIGRALAKQPEERYQTAQEFREALLAIKTGEAIA